MSIDLDWYAVVTEAQREEVAQRALRQIGVATYIPEHRAEVRRRGGRISVRRRTYPGYVFIGLQRGCEPWLRLDGCSAVIGIVGFGTPPVPARIEATCIGDVRLRQFRGLHDTVKLDPGAGAKLGANDPDLALVGRVGRIVHVISDERVLVLFGGGRVNPVGSLVSRRLDELELL